MRGSRPPVPSLLRALLDDHLDPGYAARRAAPGPPAAGPASGGRGRAWLALGALAAGAVLGVAWGSTAARTPDAEEVRSALAAEVAAARERVDGLAARRATLVAAVESARAAAVAGDRGLLEQLAVLELAAGAVPARGPGLVVTLTEPVDPPELSGGSRVGGGRATILDRDLQLVVNSLFAVGAEAVAVGGVRVGPSTAIRAAGGTVLVDNQAVVSPYVVSAIGPPRAMQSGFVITDAYVRMSAVSQLYGAGFTVVAQDEVDLPATTLRAVRLAQEAVPR